jgi:hypothetical protein
MPTYFPGQGDLTTDIKFQGSSSFLEPTSLSALPKSSSTIQTVQSDPETGSCTAISTFHSQQSQRPPLCVLIPQTLPPGFVAYVQVPFRQQLQNQKLQLTDNAGQSSPDGSSMSSLDNASTGWLNVIAEQTSCSSCNTCMTLYGLAWFRR